MKVQNDPRFVVALMGKAGAGKDTVADLILNGIGHGMKYSFADPLKQMCSEVFDIPIEWMYDQDLKKEEVMINFANPHTISMMEEWVYKEIYQNPKWRWVLAKPILSGDGDGPRYEQAAFNLLDIFYDQVLIDQGKNVLDNNSFVVTVSVRKILQLMGTEVIRNHIADTFWAEIKEPVDELTTVVMPDCRFESELDYVLSFDESMVIVVDNDDLDSSSTDGHASEELVERIDEYLESKGATAVHIKNNLQGDYDALRERVEELVIPNVNFKTEIRFYDNSHI